MVVNVLLKQKKMPQGSLKIVYIKLEWFSLRFTSFQSRIKIKSRRRDQVHIISILTI